MKKIALIIMIASFATGANAQSDTEVTAEIINDCVPEKVDSVHKKKKKKYKSRMAMFKATEQNVSSENPYYFAGMVKREDAAEEKKNVLTNN